MSDNNQVKSTVSPERSRIILAGFLVGLVVTLIAWTIDIIINKFHISFSGILQIHKGNPVIFMIDLIPFIAAITIYIVTRGREQEKEIFDAMIKERDARLDKMAEFAKQIGEGNYEAQLNLATNNDILANSLLLMRDNLLNNYKKESEQSWIAEGKALVSDILRLNNKIEELASQVIHQLVKYIKVVQGALYLFDEDQKILNNVATYGYNRKKYINQEFKLGYGLIGQCAYEMEPIYRTEIPEDYATITSGILGDQKPQSILIVPLISDEKLQGVIEFASIEPEISELTIKYLKELAEIIARTIFNLKVNQKTEQLLRESQQMTLELKENEEQLKQNAEEMRITQEQLQKSNEQLEAKILEVENAQKRLYSLLENASEIISIYDENMVMTYESPSVTKILGYTPEEMMGGKDFERLTRKGESSIKEMFRQLLENPASPVTIQYTYMRKNGKKIFIETTGRNLLDDTAINGIILNSTDITERKRAEREERLKSKMQALSENSLDMIIRLSTVGQYFYANPVVESYLQVKPAELINKTLNEVSCSEALYKYFKDTIDIIKASPQKTNTEITIPAIIDGIKTNRIMSIDAIPEFNENELETILFVSHDITEAKQIELEIQDKNRKIQDSINYAERIQSSILPDNKFVRQYLPKSFIYYKPRDVVSGDFPWFFKRGDLIYIAAIDCTGHGVPGALLSFVGYFLLNNIVDHEKKMAASEICDQLHFAVRKTLKQDKEDAEARDGMDIAFCQLDLREKEVQFAGAHRSLYLLRNGELLEYKGNRKAIGGIPHRKRAEDSFTNHIIKYKHGDKIFFFSDGLPDQLGGPEMKKYSPKRIREAIINNKDLTMEKYNAYFAEDFEKWRGNNKQIDDVLLIGIEF